MFVGGTGATVTLVLDVFVVDVAVVGTAAVALGMPDVGAVVGVVFATAWLRLFSLMFVLLLLCKLDMAGCVELFVRFSLGFTDAVAVGAELSAGGAFMGCLVEGSTMSSGFLSRLVNVGCGGGGCATYGL